MRSGTGMLLSQLKTSFKVEGTPQVCHLKSTPLYFYFAWKRRIALDKI
jgi:hypothetical protein